METVTAGIQFGGTFTPNPPIQHGFAAGSVFTVPQAFGGPVIAGALVGSSFTSDSGDLAESNLRRAATLVQSFKRTAVDQTSEAERDFKFAELINDVVHSLRPLFRRTSIAITVDCADDLVLHGVPGVLTQVLTNLCTNAFGHAFDEGTREGNIRIAARLLGSEVELRFIDDGAGMEPAAALVSGSSRARGPSARACASGARRAAAVRERCRGGAASLP